MEIDAEIQKLMETESATSKECADMITGAISDLNTNIFAQLDDIVMNLQRITKALDNLHVTVTKEKGV